MTVFTFGICMCEGINEDLGLGHDWPHLLIHDMQAFRCVIV